MCGVIGYIGHKNAVSVLIEGLRSLEYRGYDSAGIAFLRDQHIVVHRCVGKLANLEASLRITNLNSPVGIGHTRWATHGKPSEENAHPHQVNGLVLVHNGIIENYLTLKQELEAEGRRFASETDTEVIVHLMDRQIQKGKDLESAVCMALKEVRGSYAICVLSESDPDRLIAARNGCPLVAGLGNEESLVASDIPPLLRHTREILVLEDGEIAVATRKGVTIKDLKGKVKQRKVQTVSWTPMMAEKGGYRHFMLKEIHEQPQAVLDTFRGRVFPETGEILLPEIGITRREIERLHRIILVACGTSYHAALIGKFLIEELARLPVEVEIASEFRYRDPLVDEGTFFVAISQSGETADTLAALREARAKRARCVAISNAVGSTMSREADGVLYTHAGPEIGVAATKTFTAQITALYLLALFLGRARRKITPPDLTRLITELFHLPRLMEETLNRDDKIGPIVGHFSNSRYRDFLYLGRGINYPIALEGALKLKELSYIHAEGYPAGEMKHGPIALVDEKMPVVVLIPSGKVYEKVLSNIMEVKARGGVILAVATDGDRQIQTKADHVLYVPSAPPLLTPLLLAIPMQLLAYHMAILRDCDVDQPRNLAKSVTVE